MIIKKKIGLFRLYFHIGRKIAVIFRLLKIRNRPAESFILSKTPGDVREGERSMLCIFVHFDRDNKIDDYVLYYLESLYAAGMEIIFCTTAEQISESETEKLRPLCRSIIVRRNVGYDFASYRTGLREAGDLSRYDYVVLANDSVYGPLFNLKDTFAAMADTDAEFWGITDSFECLHHLQSYFLVFRKTVATSNAFTKFWREFPNFSGKMSVIMFGELEFSKRLTDSGFKMRALCESKRILAENKEINYRRESPYLLEWVRHFNHSHYDWRLLIERYRCPFIKTLLLRQNPWSIADISEWPAVVRKTSKYDPRLIKNHLSRVTRG